MDNRRPSKPQSRRYASADPSAWRRGATHAWETMRKPSRTSHTHRYIYILKKTYTYIYTYIYIYIHIYIYHTYIYIYIHMIYISSFPDANHGAGILTYMHPNDPVLWIFHTWSI